jgi:hypothetical protein
MQPAKVKIISRMSCRWGAQAKGERLAELLDYAKLCPLEQASLQQSFL